MLLDFHIKYGENAKKKKCYACNCLCLNSLVFGPLSFLGMSLFQLVAACIKSCKLWTTGCTWIFHLHSRWDSWEDAEGHTPAPESRLIFYRTSWWIVVFYCVILCNLCVILEHPNFRSSVGLDIVLCYLILIFTRKFWGNYLFCDPINKNFCNRILFIQCLCWTTYPLSFYNSHIHGIEVDIPFFFLVMLEWY